MKPGKDRKSLIKAKTQSKVLSHNSNIFPRMNVTMENKFKFKMKSKYLNQLEEDQAIPSVVNYSSDSGILGSTVFMLNNQLVRKLLCLIPATQRINVSLIHKTAAIFQHQVVWLLYLKNFNTVLKEGFSSLKLYSYSDMTLPLI